MFTLLGVALRKESVDRNLASCHLVDLGQNVALRKESVDRNFYLLSIRGVDDVALRKESVDRNASIITYVSCARRRSPQGERG